MNCLQLVSRYAPGLVVALRYLTLQVPEDGGAARSPDKARNWWRPRNLHSPF